MEKLATETRKFDGKIYRLWDWYSSQREAMAIINDMYGDREYLDNYKILGHRIVKKNHTHELWVRLTLKK
jgi:hypothetical protein